MPAVREDVHEQRAARPQPASRCARTAVRSCARARTSPPRRRGRSAASAGKSSAFTSQVIDLDVAQSEAFAARARMNVRCECEFDTPVMRLPRKPLRHVQRQRAPATAQLQDVVAISEAGALHAQGEHRLFGVGERPSGRSNSALEYFSRGPSTFSKNVGRHLVVLLVRRLGVDRERARAQAAR